MADAVEYQSPRISKDDLERQVRRLTTRPERRPPADPFPVCPSKHMTKEEIDKVTDRVYNQYRMKREEAIRAAEERQLKELGLMKKVCSHGETEDTAKRLHDECNESRRLSRNNLAERYLFKSNKVAPTVPLKVFVKHMYNDGIQREKDKEKKLYEKYILPTEIASKRISWKETAESAERLTSRTGNAG